MYAICYSKRMFFRLLDNKHMQNLIQKFYPPALLYYHDNYDKYYYDNLLYKWIN